MARRKSDRYVEVRDSQRLKPKRKTFKSIQVPKPRKRKIVPEGRGVKKEKEQSAAKQRRPFCPRNFHRFFFTIFPVACSIFFQLPPTSHLVRSCSIRNEHRLPPILFPKMITRSQRARCKWTDVGGREMRRHIRRVVNLEFERWKGGVKRSVRKKEREKMMAEEKKRRSSRETIIIN